jgi:alpha-glucuronidase
VSTTPRPARTASASTAPPPAATPRPSTPPSVAQRFSDLKTVDEKDLLWFHHLPWTYRLKSGQTLWDGLVTHYSRGVSSVDGMGKTWADLAPYVDPERHAQVADFLAIQRTGGPVVARRLDRLFPDLLGPAAAGWRSAAGPFAGLLRDLSFPYAPGIC